MSPRHDGGLKRCCRRCARRGARVGRSNGVLQCTGVYHVKYRRQCLAVGGLGVVGEAREAVLDGLGTPLWVEGVGQAQAGAQAVRIEHGVSLVSVVLKDHSIHSRRPRAAQRRSAAPTDGDGTLRSPHTITCASAARSSTPKLRIDGNLRPTTLFGRLASAPARRSNTFAAHVGRRSSMAAGTATTEEVHAGRGAVEAGGTGGGGRWRRGGGRWGNGGS